MHPDMLIDSTKYTDLQNRLASSHSYCEGLEKKISDQKTLIDNQEVELNEQFAQIEAQSVNLKRLRVTAENATATANIWIKKHKDKSVENNTLKFRLEELEKENKAIRACLKLTL